MALRIAATCCFSDFSHIQAQSEIVVQMCGLSTRETKQWISLSLRQGTASSRLARAKE